MTGYPITGLTMFLNRSASPVPSAVYYIPPITTDNPNYPSMVSLAPPSPSAREFLKGTQLLPSYSTSLSNPYSMLFALLSYGSAHTLTTHTPLGSMSMLGNPSTSGSFNTTLLLVV